MFNQIDEAEKSLVVQQDSNRTLSVA